MVSYHGVVSRVEVSRGGITWWYHEVVSRVEISRGGVTWHEHVWFRDRFVGEVAHLSH